MAEDADASMQVSVDLLLISVVASITFFTVLDLPVLVIPNKAVRLPKKSLGLTYTGTSGCLS